MPLSEGLTLNSLETDISSTILSVRWEHRALGTIQKRKEKNNVDELDGYEAWLADIKNDQIQNTLLDPRNNPRLRATRRPRKDRRGTFSAVKIINPVLARKGQERIVSHEEAEFVGWDGRRHTFLVRGEKIRASAGSALGRKPVHKHRDRRPEMRNELQKLYRKTELNRIDPIELAQMNLDENGELDADLEAERDYDERFPLPPLKPKPREVWLYL